MRKRCLRCFTAICFVFLSITGIFMSQPAAAVHAQGISDEIVYAPLESTGEYQITMVRYFWWRSFSTANSVVC